jgi:integrase
MNRVRPVAAPHIEAVLPFLSRQVVAMVRLELLSGIRSGELCGMRIKDIDRTPLIWTYSPERHKTWHHEHERVIRFGMRAKAILEPFLTDGRDPSAFVFSPVQAEAERHEQLRRDRKTPVQPSQVKRADRSRRRRRRRPPHEHFNAGSYRRAIDRACAQAFPPPPLLAKQDDETVAEWMARLSPDQVNQLKTWRKAHSWHPHQLRHSFATNIRREFGPDAALVLLGDKTTRMVDVYAEMDEAKANMVIAEVG